MKLLREKRTYTIEDINEIENPQQMAELLNCFLDKDLMLLFGCDDIDDFLDNLENEDIETKEFYKKLMNFNTEHYEESSIVQNEVEQEKKRFIDERTIFTNNGLEVSINPLNKQCRRTIWYKTENIDEILKALSMNWLFKCVVMYKNDEFNKFIYLLEHYETDSGTNLAITEGSKSDFINNLYFKIKKILEHYNLETKFVI